DWFALVEGAPTAVAFVTVDDAGEPGYLVYGFGMHAAVEAAAERLPAAVEACDALAVTSNTLVEEGERAATLAARERALELRWPPPCPTPSARPRAPPSAGAPSDRLGASLARAGGADPRPAAHGLRPSLRAAARASHRRARAHRALAVDQRPQPRRRLHPPARALPGLGGRARRAGRGGRGGHPPGRHLERQVRADPADP